ncbi:hypothetical protein [Flagellimonas allohymeniacidonis]|uniref:Uncharacterized protein n=1 Tax=Flagellimonas allohymeniacidonis TaxID=2517819 RepID=A0A4Q8QD21_9FLAO|nr:hypothetical protein [Allomuricauda hymeniacidonis]TAI47584.1 hypothetical protein EW142_13030 [Allomuricauda hymeniacidonis]
MKSKFLKIVLIVLFLVSCTNQNKKNDTLNDSQAWQLIYKNDPNGNAIFGSKSELLAIARKGYPIRVGWASRRKNDTTRSVEHTVNGDFLTIANGKELFVQIQPFYAQRPQLTGDTLSMTLLPIQSNWILSTNGLISNVSRDFNRDTTIAYPPSQFRYSLSWFAKVPDIPMDDVPLWNEPPAK